MMECKKLSVGYDRKAVLENVNFSPVQGAFTVIVGPNGCGKSTLLKTIMGEAKVLEGSLTLDGRPIKEWGTGLAQKIAYLPQNRSEVNLPVGRMVLHGRFPYMGYPRRYTKEDESRVTKALALMGISHLRDCPVSALSGGEKQKAYLAMALVQDAEYLLLDEPTTYLDMAAQLELLELLKTLTARGKTVIAVLHDLNHALCYGDYLLAIPKNKQMPVMYATSQKLLTLGYLEQIFGLRIHTLFDEYGDEHFAFTAL